MTSVVASSFALGPRVGRAARDHVLDEGAQRGLLVRPLRHCLPAPQDHHRATVNRVRDGLCGVMLERADDLSIRNVLPSRVIQYTHSVYEDAMTTRTITLTLPEDLYVQLEAQALRAARPVDDVVAQTIARGLIVASDPELAPPVQAELAAMEQLADSALWEVAGSTASSDTLALYDLLTQRQEDGTLTPQGQQWLDRLRAEADLLLLRKAHAYALLKQRGHAVPAIEELSLPPA